MVAYARLTDTNHEGDTTLLRNETMSDFNCAVAARRDVWVPACGGTEEPFTCRGRRLLYCYNPKLDKHAYLDLNTDLILSDEEAAIILP